MTKFFLSVLLLLLSMPNVMKAQSLEPDFVGEVNLVQGDGAVLLDKEYVKVKTKAGASLYLVGIGSVKTKINVEGAHAQARAGKNEDFSLIVKAVDNQSDPMSIINIFKFKQYETKRKAELASLNTFGGKNDSKLDLVEYTAKKYGESSYQITLKKKVVGEYGIIVRNPNNRDEKNLVVACFGIDPLHAEAE